MAPKKNVPDAPKTKRVMTPDQLEKLAAARVKANEVRQMMKEDRADAQMATLQAKLDAIKARQGKSSGNASKKSPEPNVSEPPEIPEPEPPEIENENSPEPETPELENENSPETENETPPEPPSKTISDDKSQELQAKPPTNVSRKGKKKKVIVMPNSESGSESDDEMSNVIFVKRSSRKKKETLVPNKIATTPRPPPNPFFSFNPHMFKNFQ